MKLELNTEICPIVNPDTYWTHWQEYISNEMWSDFIKLIEERGEKYICKALEMIDFNAKVSEAKFRSPKYYNNGGDWLNFVIEVEDDVIETMIDAIKGDDKFDDYLRFNYKSSPGYICLMPNTKADWLKAFMSDKRDKKEYAVSQFIIYQIRKEHDLKAIHDDFFWEVFNYATENGYVEEEAV